MSPIEPNEAEVRQVIEHLARARGTACRDHVVSVLVDCWEWGERFGREQAVWAAIQLLHAARFTRAHGDPVLAIQLDHLAEIISAAYDDEVTAALTTIPDDITDFF